MICPHCVMVACECAIAAAGGATGYKYIVHRLKNRKALKDAVKSLKKGEAPGHPGVPRDYPDPEAFVNPDFFKEK